MLAIGAVDGQLGLVIVIVEGTIGVLGMLATGGLLGQPAGATFLGPDATTVVLPQGLLLGVEGRACQAGMVEAGAGTVETGAGMTETDDRLGEGGRGLPGTPPGTFLGSGDATLALLSGALTEDDCGLFNHGINCVEFGGTPGEAARTCEPKGPKGVRGEFERRGPIRGEDAMGGDLADGIGTCGEVPDIRVLRTGVGGSAS